MSAELLAMLPHFLNRLHRHLGREQVAAALVVLGNAVVVEDGLVRLAPVEDVEDVTDASPVRRFRRHERRDLARVARRAARRARRRTTA